MLSSTPKDDEAWIFERILNDDDPGVIDEQHSIVYHYAGDNIIRSQYTTNGQEYHENVNNLRIKKGGGKASLFVWRVRHGTYKD